MIQYFDELQQKIKQGILGQNRGIPMKGFGTFSNHPTGKV